MTANTTLRTVAEQQGALNTSVTPSSGDVFTDLGVNRAPTLAPADNGLIERLRSNADSLSKTGILGQRPALLEAADALTALAAENERLRAEQKNMQAALTARAKSMLRLRDALTKVHDNIADEGDRCYFGSTNDADQLREVWRDLDAWSWDDIMADGELLDVYETSRKAHARAASLQTLLDKAVWQPITEDDPAPPHAVPVLLWSPPSMSHPNGHIEARPFSTGRSGNGWSEYSQHSWATHWMPLPAAPAIKEARHAGN